MQYWVHEYIIDTYVFEKCKFSLFIDSPSYYPPVYICYILDVLKAKLSALDTFLVRLILMFLA
jgi:hypothetical protein